VAERRYLNIGGRHDTAKWKPQSRRHTELRAGSSKLSAETSSNRIGGEGPLSRGVSGGDGRKKKLNSNRLACGFWGRRLLNFACHKIN